MSKHTVTAKVYLTGNEDIRVQTTLEADGGLTQQISEQVIQTQDKAIREALESRGWLSPEAARELKEENARLREGIAMANLELEENEMMSARSYPGDQKEQSNE